MPIIITNFIGQTLIKPHDIPRFIGEPPPCCMTHGDIPWQGRTACNCRCCSRVPRKPTPPSCRATRWVLPVQAGEVCGGLLLESSRNDGSELSAQRLFDIQKPHSYMIKGSLVGETSVLRTFRMSGKELVKERVRQRKS